MTIRAFMERPDSQIKASKGPAVSMVCCWMIRAFHRLGKTLCRTWQASLFPVRYAEQTRSVNWARSPRDGRRGDRFHGYLRVRGSFPLQSTQRAAPCRGLASARPAQELYRSREKVVLENKPVLKKTVRFPSLTRPRPGA